MQADKVSFSKEITKQHGFTVAPTTQARIRELKYAETIWDEYGCHPILGQRLLPPQLQPVWSAMLHTVA